MFSNLRKASSSDRGYDGGDGNRHSASLRELGALLRERREAMGVSLAEVEVATRIRQKYLSALESDEWHLLPGEVVGRGFLRNYADYLGLEPDEAIDRRRAVSDMSLSTVLANTSAGSNLPPLREVDYRPKEVELKDEGDGIQRGEIRLTPIFAILGVALLVVVAWWGVSVTAGPIGEYLSEFPDRLASIGSNQGTPQMAPADEAGDETADETAMVPPQGAGIVNPENVGMAQTQEVNPQTAPVQGQNVQPETTAQTQPEVQETQPEEQSGIGGRIAGEEPQNNEQSTEWGQQSGLILVPTSTPDQPSTPAQEDVAPQVVETAPQQVESEPVVEEPPAAVAEEVEIVLQPTPTPEPAAAPAQNVAPAACGDVRSVIATPGVNQTVDGLLGVSGNATHAEFQYFKLEYAPGLNAGGGFVYFAGSSSQIEGGILGNLDTRALPNGEYTIRLTVVDQIGNYPPPCDVSIIIQN